MLQGNSSRSGSGSVGILNSLRWNLRLIPLLRSIVSFVGGVRTRYPWSSMRMNLRFQSKVSGNWTLTSPMSITWERESLKDDCSVCDSRRSTMGAGGVCSRPFGDKEVKMLRRGPPVRLDMRFISRLVRDSFGLSSESEKGSLCESGRLAEVLFL